MGCLPLSALVLRVVDVGIHDQVVARVEDTAGF
jgi:hypothetical protein